MPIVAGGCGVSSLAMLSDGLEILAVVRPVVPGKVAAGNGPTTT